MLSRQFRIEEFVPKLWTNEQKNSETPVEIIIVHPLAIIYKLSSI